MKVGQTDLGYWPLVATTLDINGLDCFAILLRLHAILFIPFLRGETILLAKVNTIIISFLKRVRQLTEQDAKRVV